MEKTEQKIHDQTDEKTDFIVGSPHETHLSNRLLEMETPSVFSLTDRLHQKKSNPPTSPKHSYKKTSSFSFLQTPHSKLNPKTVYIN